MDLAEDEIIELNELLKKRRLNRTEAIRKEIKKSTNKTLEEFETDYPEIYIELIKSIFQFEEESLKYDTTIPIYWVV